MESEDELRAQLATLNSAITETLNGARLTKLVVGSGDFKREYNYAECSLEMLKRERTVVQQKLAAISTVEPVYRNTAPHTMHWSKF